MKHPKRVVLYNPALSSINLGDHIIASSAKQHLGPLIDDAFVVEVSTHLPPSRYMRIFKEADFRFVLGSNLLRGRMNGIFRQWDIHLGTAHWVTPAILMGAGWWQYGDEPNRYTKMLYREVLSKTHLHSVRDSYSRDMLQRCGVSNVVVTGCPTLWDLSAEHCSQIPRSKSRRVLVTLTDYSKDPQRDRALLDLLLRSYDQVLFWPQGYGDMAYLQRLMTVADHIEILSPNLAAFDAALDSGDIDYIGTRLHGGIRALQRARRSLVIAIDNRAQEMHRDFGLPIVHRGEVAALSDWIHGISETRIRLPEEEIASWKGQYVSIHDRSIHPKPGERIET